MFLAVDLAEVPAHASLRTEKVPDTFGTEKVPDTFETGRLRLRVYLPCVTLRAIFEALFDPRWLFGPE
jgi:hypothetical protein